jgi:16S rRNA (cytidine1402-2'-O)-methyltransferase
VPAIECALYVVATPLGNLRDISLRALDVLGTVDVIAAEDTRVTRVLLAHHGIATRLLSLHEHNERRRATEIVALLTAGKSVAVVSDAGTPGVSDPGSALVATVAAAGHRVVPGRAERGHRGVGTSAPRWLFCSSFPAAATARRHELERLAGCVVRSCSMRPRTRRSDRRRATQRLATAAPVTPAN